MSDETLSSSADTRSESKESREQSDRERNQKARAAVAGEYQQFEEEFDRVSASLEANTTERGMMGRDQVRDLKLRLINEITPLKKEEVSPIDSVKAAEWKEKIQTFVASNTPSKKGAEETRESEDSKGEGDLLGKIRTAKNAAQERQEELIEDLAMLRQEEQGLLKDLSSETKADPYKDSNFAVGIVAKGIDYTLSSRLQSEEKSQQLSIDRLTKNRQKMTAISSQKQTLDGEIKRYDLYLNFAESQKKEAAGDRVGSQKILLALQEEYGTTLKNIDTTIAKKVDEAITELRAAKKLSPFEEKLFDENSSPDELLQTAIAEKKKNEGLSDVLDQFNALNPIKIKNYKAPTLLRTASNKPYTYALNTLTTQSGLIVEGVTITTDALAILQKAPPAGKTFVLKRVPRSIALSTTYSERQGRGSIDYRKVLSIDLLKTDDIGFAEKEGDSLTLSDSNGKNRRTEKISDIEQSQKEDSLNIQRSLDRNPSILKTKQVASTVQQTVGHLQDFLEAAQNGSARETFVNFARGEARETLKILKDPSLQKDLEETKRVLRALKGTSGVATSEMEKTIDDQLKALDQMSMMLASGKVENLLRTIIDASKFNADTLGRFIAQDLPIIAASIVTACLAAALIVTSFGTATPLIIAASPLVLAGLIAGGTAAGSVVGREIAQEIVYQAKQQFEDVKNGQSTFTSRSSVVSYAVDEKKFNEKTGKFDTQNFSDVAVPLAKEFAVGFAVTLGTMGIGAIAGNALSKLLSNSKVVNSLVAKYPTSPILKNLTEKLAAVNALEGTIIQSGALKQRVRGILENLAKEVPEECSDELQESVLEKCLQQLDAALSAEEGGLGLGTGAGVALAILKKSKISRGGVEGGGPSRGESVIPTQAEDAAKEYQKVPSLQRLTFAKNSLERALSDSNTNRDVGIGIEQDLQRVQQEIQRLKDAEKRKTEPPMKKKLGENAPNEAGDIPRLTAAVRSLRAHLTEVSIAKEQYAKEPKTDEREENRLKEELTKIASALKKAEQQFLTAGGSFSELETSINDEVDEEKAIQAFLVTFSSKEVLSEIDIRNIKDTLKTMDIPDDVRLQIAENLLKTSLTKDQTKAILDAHNALGNIDKLSLTELVKKVKILDEAGLTKEQRKLLLKAGVCGKGEKSVITYQEILSIAQEKNLGRMQTIEPGRLVTQGVKPNAVYVLLDGGAQVSYTTGGIRLPVATLSAGALIGEISALTDGEATADVTITESSTLLTFTRDEFNTLQEGLEESSSFAGLENLANNRLEQIFTIDQKVADRRTEKENESEGILDTNSAIYKALDLRANMNEIPVTPLTFSLLGSSKGEGKEQVFTVHYKKVRSGAVGVTINSADNAVIPLTAIIDKNGKISCDTGYVQLRTDASYGYYSRILQYLLRDVDSISATVIEKNTVDFMENFNREHNNEYPPHSLLAAHSPLVSARKGFISRMGGGYYGTLEGFRVDTALFRILSRATDIERAIINEENESSDGVTFEKLCVQFGLENKEALFSSLQSDMEKYQQSDDYKNLDGSRKELVDIQAHRIMSSFRGFNENYRTRDSMPKPRSNSMRSSSIRRAFRRGRV